MNFTLDPRLQHELEDRVRSKYISSRDDLHVTDLIRCLTATYYDKVDPLPFEDQSVMFFAIGFALEEVMLRNGAEKPQVEEVDGIVMTEDYISLSGNVGVDLKTTRMRLDKDTGIPTYGWPESWIKQFMAYARKRGSLYYSVAVIELIAAKLTCGTFTFTQEELDDNWKYMLERRDIYTDAMFQAEPPESFKYNEDWECKNKTSTCRYLMRCQQRQKIEMVRQ